MAGHVFHNYLNCQPNNGSERQASQNITHNYGSNASDLQHKHRPILQLFAANAAAAVVIF